jgi:hypothetical protein
MLRVYFDDELIDVESYTELDNEYNLFTDTFKLGSVASNTFKLSVIKSAVSEQPNEVRIEDDNTTWNFIVDNIVEDDNFYAYTLTDKLVDFNFDYDASELINSKAELGEDCYLSDIWKDMCLKANVDYDDNYIFENDIVVNWYDSRVQARRYLSYIAELQSGYAYIKEDGKQSFKKQNRPSVKTIDADECSDLIIGEKKTITRVVYDGGAFKWEFGDETGDTLYLQSDNVFIVNEGIVENIYNNIKDFEFYIIDVPNAPMDSSVRAGDIITISDNGVMYPTIAQYTMSYAGGWVGSYKISVNTERQQETQVSRVADNVKNLQVYVNRLDNEFGIIAEEITKLTDFIRNVGMTGNYLRLEETAESNGAINKLSIKGFELMPLYPNMTYPSEYTYPGVLNFYTLIFDTVNTFNNNPHYIYINSPIPLQKLGSVHDELLIEQNKVKVIQRIGYDFVNEQWSVLSTPIIHELNDVLLPTFEDNTYIKVLYFDDLIYNAEYIVKNDLTSNFATQLESKSQFKINQDEITSKVSKDNLISEINQTSEQVRITANKISLEGLTTINNNFKVLLDGSIEANKGTFKGDIYLPDGGRVIGGDGMLATFNFPSEPLNWGGSTFSIIGWTNDGYITPTFYKERIQIKYSIPDNFIVVAAKVVLSHNTIQWYDYDENYIGLGYARNIKLYKKTNNSDFGIRGNANSSPVVDYNTITGTEIANAFDGAYSPPQNATGNVSNKSTIDIKNHIVSGGLNVLYLETGEGTPANLNQSVLRTGNATATLQIIGYTKFEI